MSHHEFFIWSAVAGGLLSLLALTCIDGLTARRMADTVRIALFLLLSGAAVLLVIGLPEQLWPALAAKGWLGFLKVPVGPLAGGIALYYLGLWLGGARDDAVVLRLSTWGPTLLLVLTLMLTVLAIWGGRAWWRDLMAAAGVVTVLGAVLGLLATARSVMLGNRLARWMLPACVALVALSAGLYLRGLAPAEVGPDGSILTALGALVFFPLSVALVMLRVRENKRLARLARLDPAVEPATGLPIGSKLVAEVEHALWVSKRHQGQSAVICLYLSNLYAMSEHAGRGAEYQILVAVAARIRRAAGFRCVVGLYHPLCFVVMVSSDRYRGPLAQVHAVVMARLRQHLAGPIELFGDDGQPLVFVPELGIGTIMLGADSDASALAVLNATERQARTSETTLAESAVDTQM